MALEERRLSANVKEIAGSDAARDIRRIAKVHQDQNGDGEAVVEWALDALRKELTAHLKGMK